jgi:HSP20 family protein
MNRIARRDPLLAELDAMSEGFERMFGLRPAAGGGARGWLPAVDVYETENEIVIELDVPGCHQENLSAEVVDNQLVVTGERSTSGEAVRRYRSERWQGRFVRSFSVPQGVDGSKIEAHYDDGVLRLALPKPQEARPQRISIGKRSDRTIESSAQGGATAEVGASA